MSVGPCAFCGKPHLVHLVGLYGAPRDKPLALLSWMIFGMVEFIIWMLVMLPGDSFIMIGRPANPPISLLKEGTRRWGLPNTGPWWSEGENNLISYFSGHFCLWELPCHQQCAIPTLLMPCALLLEILQIICWDYLRPKLWLIWCMLTFVLVLEKPVEPYWSWDPVEMMLWDLWLETANSVEHIDTMFVVWKWKEITCLAFIRRL